MRRNMYMNAHFTRMSEAGLQETDARFYTPVHTLTHMDFIDIPDLTAPIDRTIDDFTKLGSGWELDHIISATILTCRSCQSSIQIPNISQRTKSHRSRLPTEGERRTKI